VTAWVISVVDRLGAVGVGLLILLENLVPPVPSEVILPLAGFRARAGGIDPWLLWPAATAGSVLGALVLYRLGAWLGYERLHRLAGRRWFVLTGQRDLERGRRLFDAHGGKMVLLARCVPFVRSVISIPAGVAGMGLRRFVLLTTVGSGVWNALFLGLGWLLGEHWSRVQDWFGPVSAVVVTALIGGLVVSAVRKARSTGDREPAGTAATDRTLR
jgi:membrane protein DedA with SNARE-associated domain